MPRLEMNFQEMLRRHARESNIAALLLTSEILHYSEVGDFFEVADDGRISYLPKSRVTTPFMNGYTAKGRMRGKPGKVIRKALPPIYQQVLKDEDFEEFANLVKAWHTARGQIEFGWYRGQDIVRLYSNDYHDSSQNLGTLSHSCMQSVPSSYLELYKACPDVELLVMRMGGNRTQHVGRALVWTSNGQKFMDRVYGNDATVRAFKNYANENGILYRTENGYEGGTHFSTDGGDSGVETFEVQLDYIPDEFPYMDTMRYLNVFTRTLSNNHNHEDEVNWITLGSTGGGWYGGPIQITCPQCNGVIRRMGERADQGGYRLSYWLSQDRPPCRVCRIQTPPEASLFATEAPVVADAAHVNW